MSDDTSEVRIFDADPEQVVSVTVRELQLVLEVTKSSVWDITLTLAESVLDDFSELQRGVRVET